MHFRWEHGLERDSVLATYKHSYNYIITHGRCLRWYGLSYVLVVSCRTSSSKPPFRVKPHPDTFAINESFNIEDRIRRATGCELYLPSFLTTANRQDVFVHGPTLVMLPVGLLIKVLDGPASHVSARCAYL